MSLGNIDILIKSSKKLTNISDDIMKAVKSLAKNATTKDAVYLHYILDSVGDISCIVGNIHEVIDVEMKKIEDDLR